jgi:hypothetical protein
MGIATSANSFFRSVGSTIGVALFGTIYANSLAKHIPEKVAELGATNPAALAGATPEAGAAPDALAESIAKTQKILTERKEQLNKTLSDRTQKYKKRFVDVLVESVKKEDKSNDVSVKIYDKNIKINEDVNNMINDINKMLDE